MLSINAFVIGDGLQNSIERSDADGPVCGNCDTMRRWFLRLQDDVAAGLVNYLIAPTTAEDGGEFVAAN